MNHKVLTSSFKRTKNITSKKLFMLSLFIYTLSFTPASAQGTWTPRDTLPDSAMGQGITGFSIGNYGYAGLGNYSNAIILFDELWRFDPGTNSWAKMASFPGKARVAPASFVIGEKAYLVTGAVRNSGACVTECWEYDAATNIWTQKTSFPGSARTYAVGFAINGIGYVGTGADELHDFTKDFYAYDTAGAGSWTRIADFPGIARDASNGFAVNGYGYVCFGQDSTIKMHNDMWEYDPGTNTWSQKASNPDSMEGANGFVICNNIYVGSGDTDAIIDRYRAFWKYNTVTDTWTQETGVPGVKHEQGAAFSIGDTGYFGFGFDTVAYVHNIFYSFYSNDSCNISTGINTIDEVSALSIYPNPFEDECFIKLPKGINETPGFFLFDMEGRKLEVNITGSNNKYILKRGGLSAGIYVLDVKYNGKTFYKKLAIIK